MMGYILILLAICVVAGAFAAGVAEERARCADRVMVLYQREGATHARVEFLDAYHNAMARIETPDAAWPELGEPTTPTGASE
jgi:hypothetical protein